ncbi:MAG: DUF1490 family protein [Mycobacterium sp.]|nr:DUF1490 family protein [Mycobacterium sp.]
MQLKHTQRQRFTTPRSRTDRVEPVRGTRRAEEAAESARLKLADIVAEARERIGEEASPADRPTTW